MYGGQIASARTSCECIRREQVWVQREDDGPFSLEVLTRENWTVFWSTPEV